MTIAYIAHPIGGDPIGNLEKIAEILRFLNMRYKYLTPFAPYYGDVVALDDGNPAERERGLKNCREILERMPVDELWVCGKVTPGIQMEIDIATSRGIRVKHFPDMYEEAVAWNKQNDQWPRPDSMFP